MATGSSYVGPAACFESKGTSHVDCCRLSKHANFVLVPDGIPYCNGERGTGSTTKRSAFYRKYIYPRLSTACRDSVRSSGRLGTWVEH